MEDKRDDSDVDLSSGARCWPNCRPCYHSTWLQSVCQSVARPAGDDEDGGHLSGVCREEELPIEAGFGFCAGGGVAGGIEAGVDILSNR